MSKLYNLIDWRLDAILPEFANNKKFEDIVKDLCHETENTDAQFKALKEPVYNLNLGGIVVVMGLPIVDREKSAKLQALFYQKLFPSAKVSQDDVEDFQFEWAADGGLSTGNAIIKFKEEEKAIRVTKELNGVLLPPKFTLTFLTLNEMEEAVSSYKRDDDIQLIKQSDLMGHLADNKALEKVSFATSHPKKAILELFNYDYYDRSIGKQGVIEVSFVPNSLCFSESGNLLVAIMGNHFEVYGGRDHQLLRKFHHKLVSQVRFSRRDRMAISFNGPSDLRYGSENLIVWNVMTGDKVRSFQVSSLFHFESFQFSYSEKYLSGVVKSTSNNANLVCVYELPGCQLLMDSDTKERTPLPVEGVLALSWAPKRDALFVAGAKDTKSELAIWEIPQKARIPWMAIPYKVDSVLVKWGEHEKSILVDMVTYNKKKAENVVQLATVDWLRRQCYVNMLVLEESTEKSEFVVSPNGLFFTVMTPQKVGCNFHFYAVEEKNKSAVAVPLYQLNHQNMKYVTFSPFSNFLVLYNESKIWFAEIKKAKDKSQFKLIREVDQRVEPNSAVWTPCGRFVSFAVKNGDLFAFSLFDFIGRLIYSQDMRDVKFFAVRPTNFAKETVWPQKRRDEIANRVAMKNSEATEEDKKIRHQRKHQAGLKQNEGYEKLQKYLDEKWKIWQELEAIRVAKLGRADNAPVEKVIVVRVDKTETLEEIEDKN